MEPGSATVDAARPVPLEDLPSREGFGRIVRTQQTSTSEEDFTSQGSTMVDPSVNGHRLSAEDYRDPTLPHHRPNGNPLLSASSEQAHNGNGVPFPTSEAWPKEVAGKTIPSQDKPTLPKSTSAFVSQPDKTRLQRLHYLDWVEEENNRRGGHGRLNFREFEEAMRKDEGGMDAKTSGRRKLAYLGMWIDVASF
jgi:hypothetical protein